MENLLLRREGALENALFIEYKKISGEEPLDTVKLGRVLANMLESILSGNKEEVNRLFLSYSRNNGQITDHDLVFINSVLVQDNSPVVALDYPLADFVVGCMLKNMGRIVTSEARAA